MPSRPKPQRVQFFVTLVLICTLGTFILPIARTEPHALHTYLAKLHVANRILFWETASILLTWILFKLFKPRIAQLQYFYRYPPAWAGGVIGITLVACFDLFVENPQGYSQSTVFDWILFGFIPVLTVGLITGLWEEVDKLCVTKYYRSTGLVPNLPEAISSEEIAVAPWEVIHDWMHIGQPSKYDLLDSRSVAKRLAKQILAGKRSLGIVGPFGSGKTTIVEWLCEYVNTKEAAKPKYIICPHSCWGFETSDKAISSILTSAVEKLCERVDTFEINSMPDAYRNTFSDVGGNWSKWIIDLVFANPSPHQQFERLSELLEGIDAKLVLIVEDLDRNDTHKFEIQEVVAFLERIKHIKHVHFVLTAGRRATSKPIDFARLCDHVEVMKSLRETQVSKLIQRVISRCHDNLAFPQIQLYHIESQLYAWEAINWVLLSDQEAVSFPKAACKLLSTPRFLRLTLWQTYTTWEELAGEINFNHLLAVNTLRFGAPEAFEFLERQWDRLSTVPEKDVAKSVQRFVQNDWEKTCENADWSSIAALRVIEFLLPNSKVWLSGDESSGTHSNDPQGIQEERYWRRAVSGQIDSTDVGDQEVLRDISMWFASNFTDDSMLTKIVSNEAYEHTWESLIPDRIRSYFPSKAGERVRELRLKIDPQVKAVVRDLCRQIIEKLLEQHGRNADHESLGFSAAFRLATKCLQGDEGNSQWLKQVVQSSAMHSITLTNALWHYFGNPGAHSIILAKNGEDVRRYVRDEIRKNVADWKSLDEKLHDKELAAIYQLVFDPGVERQPILTAVTEWSWMGPIIFDAMRKGSVKAIGNCAVLLGARVSARDGVNIDVDVLKSFFGQSAGEVLDLIEEMKGRLPDAEHQMIENVVKAGRAYLNTRDEPVVTAQSE